MYRKGGNSICIVQQSIRKIHTTFADGSELVEEYNNETHQLLSRRRRASSKAGAAGSWEVLLGEAQKPRTAAAAPDTGGLLMQESSSNPVCVRVDTPGFFTWRITNLPYPPSVYRVDAAADPSCTTIVVSTSNKKYYKRLPLPEMQLLGLALDPSRISWSHQDSTLTVHYRKPAALLEQELADSKSAMAVRPQEDPADCRQQ